MLRLRANRAVTALRSLKLAVLSGLLGLGSLCGRAPREEGARADAPSVVAHATVDAGHAPEAAPPQDLPAVDRAVPLVEPITPRMLAAMQAIAARRPDLRPNVFAKLGGSSVVNRSFLHCFEDEPALDLGGRPLDETLAFFRGGRVLSHTPFGRTSLGAGVGWSIRQAMSGRPPSVIRELEASGARIGLAYFGGNDVEGRNAHQFAQRLDRVITTLAERGVVPVLSATYPRLASDPDMNDQVERYNRMSRALALAHGLPYVDVHQAMLPLPGRGLAGDGYHPNTYVVGPRAKGCDFGAEGLRYGNNHRNLLTLTALDGVRRTLVAGESPPGRDVDEPGTGTATDPVRLRALPFARRLVPGDLEAAESAACGAGDVYTHRYTVRFMLAAPRRMRLSAVAMGPLQADLALVSGSNCRDLADDEALVQVPAGVHTLEVRVRTPRRPTEDQRSAQPRLLVVATATN